jgi:hypothetical protein
MQLRCVLLQRACVGCMPQCTRMNCACKPNNVVCDACTDSTEAASHAAKHTRHNASMHQLHHQSIALAVVLTVVTACWTTAST